MQSIDNNPVVIYENDQGHIKIDVHLSNETLWLSLNQISQLFHRDKSVISRHLKNIFNEEELHKNSVVAFFATTASDAKTYKVEYYNLDAILSVGYRVNSKQGTLFRKWASNILKDYLVKGYSLNQEKLLSGKIKELQMSIDLISKTLANNDLVTETGIAVIEIIKSYSKTWDLLIKYDEENVTPPLKLHQTSEEIISYKYAKELIAKFQEQLGISGLFGIERENGLQGILGNLMQSFDGQDLYPSAEEKAAHLLYFVIKDHPFSDGNKRIGSFLFLLYIRMSNIESSKLNDNTLTALALLVAQSDASQKDVVIKLIMNLIN
jgi:prophage maintenance system killer protein